VEVVADEDTPGKVVIFGEVAPWFEVMDAFLLVVWCVAVDD